MIVMMMINKFVESIQNDVNNLNVQERRCRHDNIRKTRNEMFSQFSIMPSLIQISFYVNSTGFPLKPHINIEVYNKLFVLNK